MGGIAAVLAEAGVGTGVRLLAAGESAATLAELRDAGHRPQTHRLDTNPLAGLRGQPFTPPVVAWPMPDAAFDVVVLGPDLALVVDDEAAVAEAARTLRPGGLLVVDVPNNGPLAWLDADNAYRYVRDITRRGPRLHHARGVGWRRHYGEHDLRALLAPAFGPPVFRTEAVAAGEASRLALRLLCNWLPDRDQAPPDRLVVASDALARRERALRPAGWGSALVAVARRAEP